MLKNIIEALLFASGGCLPAETIYHGLKDYTRLEINHAMEELKEEYSGEKGIYLIEFNNKYQLQSNPFYGEIISDLLMETRERELSKTLLQVLAIVAYKQPITRQEIEDLRGVNSDYVIATLLKLNLIEAQGRKEALGHPILYGTSEEFLKKFGLPSLSDLPDYDELMYKIRTNYEKYYAKSGDLYRERDIESEERAAEKGAVPSSDAEKEIAAADDSNDSIEEEDDDALPDFLKDEDVVEID